MPNRKLFMAAGVLVAVLVAGLGYMAYGAAQKRAQQKQVAELVRDTTDKLKQVLEAKTAPDLVAALDANLQAAKAPRDRALTDAAEHYIIGAREIARRRVEIERRERQAAASRQALAGHMARASQRNDAWLRNAVALKKRVETEYFELGVSLKALEELLFTMPEAEKRLSPHVGQALLIEAAVRESARMQAQEDLKRASAELEKLRGQRR